MKLTIAGMTSLFLLFVTACGSIDGTDNKDNEANPERNSRPRTLQGVDGLDIKLYGGMSDDVGNLVQRDLRRISSFQLNSTSQDFIDVFGGNSSQDIINFLNTRIKIIVPYDFSFQNYIVGATTSSVTLPALAAARPSVVAQNLGTSLWLSTFQSADTRNARLVFGNQAIPINSPRIGVVQLGENYGSRLGASGFTESTRTSVWVHEARHSDCTGGLSDLQKKVLASSSTPDLYNWKCGHTHAICPAGHEFQGLAACENQDWGAYSVGAVYSTEIANSCTNCSQSQIEQAKIEALDSWSRVLNAEDLRAGRLGRPDMSSAY